MSLSKPVVTPMEKQFEQQDLEGEQIDDFTVQAGNWKPRLSWSGLQSIS